MLCGHFVSCNLNHAGMGKKTWKKGNGRQLSLQEAGSRTAVISDIV